VLSSLHCEKNELISGEEAKHEFNLKVDLPALKFLENKFPGTHCKSIEEVLCPATDWEYKTT